MYAAEGDVIAKAFRGRLKNFRKLGIPLNHAPGKGAKVQYADEQVWQWLWCLELSEFGIDPRQIAAFLRSHWDSEILLNTKKAFGQHGEDAVIFCSEPNLMSTVWSPCDPLECGWARSSGDATLSRRTLIINVSQLLDAFLLASR